MALNKQHMHLKHGLRATLLQSFYLLKKHVILAPKARRCAYFKSMSRLHEQNPWVFSRCTIV